MKCNECGADLPGAETCLNRFHALLASERHSEEAARMHGLTVLTFHTQHPSLVKPWYQAGAYQALRRIFGQGEDWSWVLRDTSRKAGTNRFKSGIAEIPAYVVRGPVSGEMTIADLDPEAPPGHADRVMAWARSVTEKRVLV